MSFSSRVLAVLLLALPLATAGCGGGDGGARDLTTGDLALMVLPKEELGDKFAGLEVFSEESGPRTNETFVEGFDDASEGEQFVEEFGRVTGYDRVYQGAALIAQSLTIYETSNGASGALESVLGEAGEQPDIELEEFDAGDIGDESRAAMLRQPGIALSAMVFFRIDEIAALFVITVSEASPLEDEKALQTDVRDLAPKLAERIEAALED